MVGGIPKYHSHLDYYRPSRRAPAADMWSQINRGVQGALGGFMKHQQEKEYNNFQEGTGAFYSSINKDMSQEEIAKKAMEIKKTYKFNKDYASKFDLAVGRIVKQAPTQEQLDVYRTEQEGIAEKKETNRIEKEKTKLINNEISRIIGGANQHVYTTGISSSVKTNTKNRLDYSIGQLDELKKNKEILPEVIKKIDLGVKKEFLSGSNVNKMMTQEDRRRNEAIRLQAKIDKETEITNLKKEDVKNKYINKTEKNLTVVGSGLTRLKDKTLSVDSDNKKKLANASISKLYLLWDDAIKMEDVKTLNEIANSYNQIVKTMMEGGRLSQGKNRKFISEMDNRIWKDRIGEIIGYKSNENIKASILNPLSYISPETKVPNEITMANIGELKKQLGKNKMRELYRVFAPYINRSTEDNRLVSDIFIFNYITKYGEIDGF